MEKKLSYIAPTAEIVRLNLTDPIQQDWLEIASGEDETLGREHGGSFFDDEELDDGFLNGGPNMFTDWEDKDQF